MQCHYKSDGIIHDVFESTRLPRGNNSPELTLLSCVVLKKTKHELFFIYIKTLAPEETNIQFSESRNLYLPFSVLEIEIEIHRKAG